MNHSNWKFEGAQLGDFEALLEIVGKDVSISKIGVKENGQVSSFPFGNYRIDSGELSIVDRGGGPAVRIQGRGFSSWVTSWVLKSWKNADGLIEFETENSIYLVRMLPQ